MTEKLKNAKSEEKAPEPNQPRYYKTLTEALASRALQPQDDELIYFSIGSYNSFDAREGYGYLQALPLFAEKLLRANRNIKIVLCDPLWTEKNFDRSDLAHYLKKSGLEKYKKKFHCVEASLGQNNFPDMIAYFGSILQKRGAVFLADYCLLELMPVYSSLQEKRKAENYLNRLYYFRWTGVALNGVRHGFGYDVAVEVWDGEPFTKVDCALFRLRCQRFGGLLHMLSGSGVEFQKRRIKRAEERFSQPPTANDIRELERLNEDLAEEKAGMEKYQALMTAHEESSMQAELDDFVKTSSMNNHLLRGFNSLEVSAAEFELIQKDLVNPARKLACRLGSLLPVKQAPLVEFKETEGSDGSLAITLVLPERNLLELFSWDVVQDLLAIAPVVKNDPSEFKVFKPS